MARRIGTPTQMMSNQAISVVAAMALWQVAVYADGTESVRAKFEGLASQQSSLNPIPFIEGAYRDSQDPHVQAIATVVTDPRNSPQELTELLGHPDSKVRTLAILALFDREDPQLLPPVAALLSDKTPAFKSGQFEETVAQIAERAIRFYLDRDGYQYVVDPKAAFEEYWAARRDRAFCLSWFRVRLARARGHKNEAARRKAIQAVHDDIDALPPAERGLTWLWLKGRSKVWVNPPEDFVEDCRNVGPDQLMLVLRRQVPSDDPDLSPERDSIRYGLLVLNILRSAKWVLRKEDAPILVAREMEERQLIQEVEERRARIREQMDALYDQLERQEDDEVDQADLDKIDALEKQTHEFVGEITITPEWVIAAAELDPEHAELWLTDALKRFTGPQAADIAEARQRIVQGASRRNDRLPVSSTPGVQGAVTR